MMNKTVRIVLYIFSVAIAGFVLFMMIFGVPGKGKQKPGHTGDDDVTEAAETEEVSLYEAIVTEASTEQLKANMTAASAGDESGETVILFTGDVLFANSFTTNYDSKGIEGVLSSELLTELNAADILMINNEFPFSDRGEAMEEKEYTFECSPSYSVALTEMGVDVASLANNHTLDFGKDALSDTFDVMDELGILYVGAGDSAGRAEAVQIIEVNGKKYGFLAASRVIPVGSWNVESSTPGIFACYDDTRLVELVKEAKESCDFLAVYPHWGVEYEAYPQDYQTKIAKDCIEAGADLIVGSHTHCLQGVEYIDGKPVFYSLGNFMFGRDIDRSAIVKVTINADGDASYSLIPVYAEEGQTRIAASTKADEILTYIDRISDANISTEGLVTE